MPDLSPIDPAERPPSFVAPVVLIGVVALIGAVAGWIAKGWW